MAKNKQSIISAGGFVRTMKQKIFYGILLLFLVTAGCRPPEDTHQDISLNWEIEPDPPVVGNATLHISLTDSTEQQLTGADITLEGNMSHPGMTPVYAETEEKEPGSYSAEVEFTMGGDWFFLVESTLPDSQTIQHRIYVPGVRSQ